MLEVFVRFLTLGCMSFGGPIAHIGYFHKEFVERRGWLKDEEFTSGLSLCQFLPGPASSQMGMLIGHHRAGYAGAFAAFAGFTFPSFVLLTFLAAYSATLEDNGWFEMVMAGAKLLAVVVVADALITMGKKFLSDTTTWIVAALTAVWVIAIPGVVTQLLPIVVAGIAGSVFIKSDTSAKASAHNLSRTGSVVLLGIFVLFLVVPIVFDSNPLAVIFGIFYQAGAFVFGGGHVVLPLLQPMAGTLVPDNALVEAYAAAQLVPGPMFTMASYLGAAAFESSPWLGSAVATLAVFLPGTLLLFAVLPVWKALMDLPRLAGGIRLINAAVLGLLAAAFYTPVWESAVHSVADIAVVLCGLLVMRKYNVSVFLLAALLIAYRFLLHFIFM
ncbi:chromate efflux transporter [Parasalinivibrio latis]|uniref:chromate efflux transporter n=1 Tax=Parasalinivibrio latis TaxID=2952610 RepID=UPI0030E2D785